MFSKRTMIVIALLTVSFFFIMGSGLLESREGMTNILQDVNIEKKEEKLQGKKPERVMYMTSGIKRNSSYDSRGEAIKMPFEPEKTGAFVNSALHNNYTNAI